MNYPTIDITDDLKNEIKKLDNKLCPVCRYFLIDIVSWDQPLRFCQKCNWQIEIGEKLYDMDK